MRPPLNQVRICVLALSLVFALIAFLFLLGSYTAQAQGPTTRYVASGGDCGGVIPCYVTIQTAIDTAVTGDTIKVAQGVYTSTAFQVIYISKAITVTGGYVPTDWANSYPVTRPTVIDAENVTRRRAVHVDGTNVAIITLTGLTIQRGWAQADGGGVYIVTGTVVLEDSRVISNTASGRGGGVYVGGGTLFLRRSIIQSNSAAGSGGGVYLSNSLATLTGNTILSNTASYEGGGLYAEGGNWLGVLDGSVTVSDNTFEGNSASVNGGGAYIGRYVGASVLSLNSFLTNTAQYGGGVYLSGGPAIVSGTSFQSNTAFRGGGLYMWASTTTLSDCEFSDNQASEGGAVYVDVWTGDAIITISDNLLHRNWSNYGGALYIASGRLTLSANTILSNTAASSGAGIEINSGIVSATQKLKRVELMVGRASGRVWRHASANE